MTFDYTERVHDSIVKQLVPDRYQEGLHYYLYQNMHEYSVYAVNPENGEEAWKEAVRIDYEQPEVTRQNKELPYKGRWFSNKKPHMTIMWMTRFVTVLLAVISVSLLFILKQIGF